MNIFENGEIKQYLLNGVTSNIMADAYDTHNIIYKSAWIRINLLNEVGNAYVLDLGWDPDTTLMLYDLPNGYNLAPIDGVGSIGYEVVNKLTCFCFFIKDMTLEKLADMFNKTYKLKAFL